MDENTFLLENLDQLHDRPGGSMNKRDFSSLLALAQVVFYLVTGIWPLVSRRTFEAVTGPKVDFWLVQTTGLLIAVIGGVLGLSGLRGKPSTEVTALGVGSAASLAGADVVFVGKGRIRRVYLLDALAEIALIAL
jgi:hypothetical protein